MKKYLSQNANVAVMEQISISEVVGELKEIRKDLEYIKVHMVDVDTILTHEEEMRLDESLKEYKEGKVTRFEDFEKEMEK